MDGRSVRMLILGIVIGGVAGVAALGGVAAAWGWRAGAAAQGHNVIVLPVRSVQDQVPSINPREFVPMPNTGAAPGQGQQLSPGVGNQDCNRILFFYQGRLYQLRPGPMPPNGGNPEFFFMQPYDGPQIPGFPGQMTPGMPLPALPGQPLPPTFKF